MRARTGLREPRAGNRPRPPRLTQRVVSIDQASVDRVLLRLRLVKDDIELVETQAISLLQEFRRQLMTDAA